jgi:hypothetical protein
MCDKSTYEFLKKLREHPCTIEMAKACKMTFDDNAGGYVSLECNQTESDIVTAYWPEFLTSLEQAGNYSSSLARSHNYRGHDFAAGGEE